MCGKPNVKVEAPKPPNMPPPIPAPPPPPRAQQPQPLQAANAAPDIRIGAAKRERSDGNRSQRGSKSLTISNNNQGLNI